MKEWPVLQAWQNSVRFAMTLIMAHVHKVEDAAGRLRQRKFESGPTKTSRVRVSKCVAKNVICGQTKQCKLGF